MSASLLSLRRVAVSVCLVLVSMCLVSLEAKKTKCQHQGYDLTSITGNDLYYDNGTVIWAIRPCGVVADPSFCADSLFEGGGEFCEGFTTISISNVSSALFLPTSREALWAQFAYEGQVGVTQFLQDGTFCNAIQADREGTIEYVCNTTATTPFISNVTEDSPCHYRAIIQTAVICSQVPPDELSITAGTNIVSPDCGGGIYNLSALTGVDIVSPLMFDSLGNANYTYLLRVCGTLSSTQCSGDSSVCQIDESATNTAEGLNYTLAIWEPTVSPVVWQYFGDNTMAAILQDGGGCGFETPNNRLTNITFVCNSSASAPAIVSALEGPPCTYVITVQTDAVCGAAFASFPAYSSSSSSSSSSATSFASSTAAGSSSSSSSPSFDLSSSSSSSYVPIAVPLTKCHHQGYDLTNLTGVDLFYDNGTVIYAIHPCGTVTDPYYCTDQFDIVRGQFCAGANTISIANPNAAFFDQAGRAALWAQLEYDGQYGVAEILQDGTYCGAIDADTEGTIIYVCNATATTPFISNVTELTTCHYQAVIQTAVICPQVPPDGVSITKHTNIISSECGGGIYNLSSISGVDIISAVFVDTASFLSANYSYVVRVCGTTSASSPCAEGASVCQLSEFENGTATGVNFTLAVWEPAVSPVVWQYLDHGIMSAILQDGEGCSFEEPADRLTNITFVCNSSATIPVIVNAVEQPLCTYTITVQTDAVCGPAFASFPPYSSSSSSSSATPFGSSSSSSSAPFSGFGSSSSSYVPISVPLKECYHQGYNLTELTGRDLYYTDGTSNYVIHPCGAVTDPAYCEDLFGVSPGEFCDGYYTISISKASNAIDLAVNRGALWAQFDYDGEVGVAQFLQDGTYCDAIQADREGTIEYVCNATATTPFISAVTEESLCHFRAVIQTAVICAQLPLTGVSMTAGTNIVSPVCGGGIYDLSALTGVDIVSPLIVDTLASVNYTYLVRVCGTLSSTQCSGDSSVCQIDESATGFSTGLNFTLAIWEPTVSPVLWQFLGEGAMAIILQDGVGCGGVTAVNRLTNITFVCDTTATTPTIVSAVEHPTCSYDITIHTNAVCGAAFQVPPPATSSSSSSATPPPSLSSSSTASAHVIGDPQFVGLLGQSYQVHGIDGAVYSLISEQAAQVNARFAFLTGPRPCPAVQPSIACWSHDGSYLSELGLFTPNAMLFVRAGPAATGFAAVELTNTSAANTATARVDDLSYEQLSSHRLTVTLGSFSLSIDNSDGFVNLACVTPLKQLPQLTSHGLLGQTHRRAKSGSSGLSGVIEGEVDDYVVEGGLFAVNDVYNRYGVASLQ